jgi:hypothetical protein
MRLHFAGLILLFLVNGSLASGQWDTDQFLFSSGLQQPRPKTVPMVKPVDGKNQSRPTPEAFEVMEPGGPGSRLPTNPLSPPTSSEAPVLAPALSSRPTKDTESGQSKVSLEGQLAYQNFAMRGNFEALQFSQGAASAGLRLNLASASLGEFHFYYLLVPELAVSRNSTASGFGKFHWDDVGIEYFFFREQLAAEVQVGAVAGESTWWGHSGVKTSNLLQLNYWGAALAIRQRPSQQGGQSLNLQAFPWVGAGQAQMRGLGYRLEYSRLLGTAGRKAMAIALSFEQFNFKGGVDQEIRLQQQVLGASVHYILSAD